MPRSLFSTRARRKTALDRWLDEPINYGGELWSRGAVIRDLKRCGLDDRCVDRYLQGAELAIRLTEQRRNLKLLTTLLQ